MTISRLKREKLWPRLRLNTPGNFMRADDPRFRAAVVRWNDRKRHYKAMPWQTFSWDQTCRQLYRYRKFASRKDRRSVGEIVVHTSLDKQRRRGMKRIRLGCKTPDPAAKKPRHAKLDDVRIDGVRRAREAVTHNLGLYGSGDPGPLILSASGNGFSADLRNEINTRYPGQVHVSPSFLLGLVVLYIRKYESGLPMVDFLSTRRPTTTD